MIFDEITLIICGVLLLFAIITPLFNPFYRWNGKSNRKDYSNSSEESGNNSLPQISVIITVHDNAREIKKHLPYFLNQHYNGNFQIIVVSEKGDSETDEILKRFSADEKLYTTFIPDSSRYMSRKKLAITIGVKAAKYEWIVLASAFNEPTSEEWLSTIAKDMTSDNNLVISYSTYTDDAKSYYHFDNLCAFYSLGYEALKKIGYRNHCDNIAFRKRDFMEENGFRGNLNLIRGEFDFIMNKYAKKGKTAIISSPKAWLRSDAPSKKEWHDNKVFYMETRKHLARSLSHRIRYNLDMLLMHLNYILQLAAIVYSILMHNWLITIIAGISLIITIFIRILLAKKAITKYNAKVSVWKIIPFEISIIWHNLSEMIRYKVANKNDFTSHKL